MLENPLAAVAASVDSPTEFEQPKIPLTVDASVILQSGSAYLQFCELVGNTFSCTLALSVSVTGLGTGSQAVDRLQRICSAIAACVAPHTTAPQDVELVIDAGAMMPEQAWAARSSVLGHGPLYLLASERNIRDYLADRTRYTRFWQSLWRLQSGRHVRLACAPLVRSRCPLLAHEVGTVVLPQASVQVPAHSAWITCSIDLCRFADVDGVIDRPALRADLHRRIDTGLTAHAHFDWPNARMQYDSWLNRRLAISVSGIGDLVVRRGQDPRDLACLASLRRSLRWLQSAVSERLRDIALADGAAPAIDHLESVLASGGNRERWEARWSAARHEHATACRSALVLSPWSVFPSLIEAKPAYLNLLPILEFADACAFLAPPRLIGWNPRDFIQLYQRTWAILERRGGLQLFAEGV